MWNSRHRKLKQELRRIGWSQFDVMLREGERVTFENAIHSYGTLPWQDAATPLRWEGTLAEALDLLATLPDEPEGANAVWRTLCPDAELYFRDWDEWCAEQEQLQEELRRFGVLKPRATFLGYDRPNRRLEQTLREGRRPPQPWTHGLYAFERGVRGQGDKRVFVDLNLRWRGTAAQFVDRTSLLPDGCGSEAFWRVFPKPDEAEGQTTFGAQEGHEPEASEA